MIELSGVDIDKLNDACIGDIIECEEVTLEVVQSNSNTCRECVLFWETRLEDCDTINCRSDETIDKEEHYFMRY